MNIKTSITTAVVSLVVSGALSIEPLRAAEPFERQISLRAHDGPFVVAEGGGGGAVSATSEAAGAWETFTLVDLDGGDLVDGDAVAFRASSGAYLAAENGGGAGLTATGAAIGTAETFRLYSLDSPGGLVESGAAVSILAPDGASFVSAENGGGSAVTASGTNTGGWQTFQFLAY